MVCGENGKMRTILHSDLNNFYASVEIMKNPALKDVPLAVTGSVEDRHGIVLAKNQPQKREVTVNFIQKIRSAIEKR